MRNSLKLVRKNSYEVHRLHSRYSQFFEELCSTLEVDSTGRKMADFSNQLQNKFSEIPPEFDTTLRKTIDRVKDAIYNILSSFPLEPKEIRCLQEQQRQGIADICSIIHMMELEEIFSQAQLALPIIGRLRTALDPAIKEESRNYYQLTLKLQAQIEQLLLPFLVVKEFHRQKGEWKGTDMELIEAVSDDIAKQTFESVVKEYLHQQAKRFGEEICRICERSIEIQEMAHHIAQCCKLYEERQRMKESERDISVLLEELRITHETVNDNSIECVMELFSKVMEDGKINFHLIEGQYLEAFRKFAAEEVDFGNQSVVDKLRKATKAVLPKWSSENYQAGPNDADSTLMITVTPPQHTHSNNVNEQFEPSPISRLALECLDASSDEPQNLRTPTARSRHLLVVTPTSNDSTSKRSSCDSKQLSEDEKSQSTRSLTQKKIGFKDFKVIKLLGKGAFGKVFLARRKLTKDLYAMKMIELNSSQDQAALRDLISQHEIFKKIGGQHLVKAAFSFSEGSAHFFLMEYMKGGDFAQLLKEEVYLEEGRARHYIAEIVLAIEHLHSFGIIHRDLKPSNLVLDDDGHIKLTDFGLSLDKKNDDGEKRIIGTPDYIAPEILTDGCSNHKSVDWWSLGVLVYQILMGARPFSGQTIQEVYDNILKGEIEWPEVGYSSGMITPEAKNLIELLLVADPQKRLGEKGAQDIKTHAFFRKVNWEIVKSQQMSFKPSPQQVKYEQDNQLTQSIQKSINRPITLNRLQKLDDLVRFDVLSEQTIKSVEKGKTRNSKRLSQIHTLTRKVQKHFA